MKSMKALNSVRSSDKFALNYCDSTRFDIAGDKDIDEAIIESMRTAKEDQERQAGKKVIDLTEVLTFFTCFGP